MVFKISAKNSPIKFWHTFMHVSVLFRIMKSAGLYLLLFSSYSKNSHTHCFLKTTLVNETNTFLSWNFFLRRILCIEEFFKKPVFGRRISPVRNKIFLSITYALESSFDVLSDYHILDFRKPKLRVFRNRGFRWRESLIFEILLT